MAWSFDRDAYLPGDTAIAVTAVGWGHNPSLGTPADGPYFAYALSLSDREAETDHWPQIPSSAIEVGEVQVGLDPVELSPGFLAGPYHARVEFIVPDVAPGTYELLHCNRPCTKTLGDITWGRFVVIGEQGATVPPAPSSEAPAPIAIALSPSGPTADPPPTGSLAVVVAAALALALVVTGSRLRKPGARTRSLGSSAELRARLRQGSP